jgi:hypothetical protein
MLDEHKFYTNQIIVWTKKFFDSPGLDISDDNQDKSCGSRPDEVNAIVEGNIRTCLPDFLARNIVDEPNLYILGEAKTLNDFFKRSAEAENQMNVMINFLKKQERPILVYSVPETIVVNIKNILNSKLKRFDAENIQVEVIDQYFK